MELGLASPSSPTDVIDALVASMPAGANLVVPIANGEPVALIDALEDRASELDGVRIHQMHALHDRRYIRGEFPGQLEHVAWFLSPITRKAFANGTCHFAPANFSEVPQFLLAKSPHVVLAAASPPDEHGFFSLGVSADYVAPMIGRVPFVLEVNESMPRTYGANRLHHSEVAAWCRVDTPLYATQRPKVTAADEAIADLVAERIPDRATIQLGIGSIPLAVAERLVDHEDLGVHTELLSDPVIDLVEAGAVTGVHKRAHRGRIVTTFALGTQRLYNFCHGNDLIEFLGVDEVNDPRAIGREPNFRSVNGTLQVDLYGQCASETLGTNYVSGSGGQADFARGAQYSEGGDGFVVLRSTTNAGQTSRIVPALDTGAVVTTQKNTVDNVVTEYGVAELQGRTLDERARALIAVAAPQHRERLERQARDWGILR